MANSMEKAQVLNTSFTSVFTGEINLQQSQAPVSRPLRLQESARGGSGIFGRGGSG